MTTTTRNTNFQSPVITDGIYYFPSYEAARALIEAVHGDTESSRIVFYARGWAIQMSVGGPYLGPAHVGIPPQGQY